LLAQTVTYNNTNEGMKKEGHQPIIEIIDYQEAYKADIKRLNYEWLEKYFKIEPGDELSLSNPQQYILDKGGYIFFARWNEEVVGTASLLKKSDAVYELGKMAVTGKLQGMGIGKRLLEHCLVFARQKKIPTLILYSNTQLSSAIYLYRHYGFTEVPLETGLYERANIKMQLHL
jgi:ribosomal protein S18 acetylase RimI-like enzyme